MSNLLMLSSAVFASLLGIGLGIAILQRWMTKKRFKNGWNAKEFFIMPLEQQGIPIAITEAFLQFMHSEKPYPFIPNERLFSATFWEEEDIEKALSQLAKICHKKNPESGNEFRCLVCNIDTIYDFLKVLTDLPNQ